MPINAQECKKNSREILGIIPRNSRLFLEYSGNSLNFFIRVNMKGQCHERSSNFFV